jgi:hypothetical protein
MPSTFSPNLRIELIGNGEQAGNWGSSTNTNLGTIIEAAISGYETVSVTTANQAFTHADGAADQARNAMIELTTTTGAAFAVYAPPSPKTYIIYNASAYTATIYNSTVVGNTTAAGTGVAIPAGKTMTVLTDGSDFSTTYSATAGAADTQPFGTSTTAIATTAFVQTALQALHPVGSIYINATNATNPGTLLGFGTWTAFGAGRVPVGFNAADPLFDAAEETGGSKDATLPTHTHEASTALANAHSHSLQQTLLIGDLNVTQGQNMVYGQGSLGLTGVGGGIAMTTNSVAAHNHTVTVDSAGSSGTNANLQPYITVYMWKRTA